MSARALVLVLFVAACGDSGGVRVDAAPIDPGAVVTYGAVHSGQYQLGPVEWTGSYWNACAPYPGEIQTLEGGDLGGVNNAYGGDGSLCDACALVQTATGRAALVRLVTYGDSAPEDMDVSQSVFDALTTGEYPRTMTWQLARCPDSGAIRYQFQTGANVWWTSLWVRNPRVPIEKVEVKSTNHASWSALTRGGDGTFTDGGGFGDGAFTLRVTGIDGSTVEDSFPSFTPGGLLVGAGNLE